MDYRYSPSVFARAPDISAETIYVIGGLYGNAQALDAILRMAAQEPISPLLVFNGDFHWFDVDHPTFARIDAAVKQHVTLRGNVETELGQEGATGCGCAYPDYVSDEDVARSNAIMAQLAQTARQVEGNWSALPMHAVAQVGASRIAIVHGDASSLAGWGFAHDALHETEHQQRLLAVCEQCDLVGFASSHTCLPTLRRFSQEGRVRFVANNGAAGMPNFAGTHYGLITRLSVHPAAEDTAQYGLLVDGLHVDALPVHYDARAFATQFERNWPAGSAAHVSYWQRITQGPNFAPPHALGLLRAASVCA